MLPRRSSESRLASAQALEEVDAATRAELLEAFTESHYGASILKVGWRAPVWDADAFEVLDVARRRREERYRLDARRGTAMNLRLVRL